MKFLRDQLDRVAPLFEKGGKLEKLYPIYEAQDTILFTPGEVTKGKTHVRDALDLKRMMIMVVVALVPAILMALYNTGLQANTLIHGGNAQPLDAWQTSLFHAIAGSYEPTLINNVLHGAMWFIPLFAITGIVGGLVEVVSAIKRGHEVNEGFLVTMFLFPLSLPPTLPLWQAGLGIAFGVIFAKEVFGGTGMNVLNVALTGRAFLFFAYPGQISGDQPWIAATVTDGASGATWLAQFAADGTLAKSLESAGTLGQTWLNGFWGFVPGSMGETSAFACLLGAAILIASQIGSWRTMIGVAVGTAATGFLLNAVAGEASAAIYHMPWYFHFVLGGWAFGTVFMATDPVTSAFTEKGKLVYGFMIGVMVVLVRVVNPAYPEGMMLAILFMNMFAPLIDHVFVQANIKRRVARGS
ncbi:MAG: NADH:ubiquinone reductase (Na(+)-transporting) subunit B [Myxococcales bacterium]|nr:NADH:ubiquinone reductase (Na(+)-transporting) subunit B [Myxococcales bacterium]MCB9522787.1 NADH:ubiquinone reductase (Na(+)-transporting) subunit B [Myxococcales bacterium]